MNEKTPTDLVGDGVPPEENSGSQTPPAASKRLRSALARAIAALIIATILLATTGFSVVDLLRGPAETADIQNETEGAFVLREVNAIFGFYADEVSSSGKVTARYALVPMGGKLVSVRLTSRYLESADTVMQNTSDAIQGITSSIDQYFVVQGTVGKVTEANSALMYDWFGLNKDSLAMMGVIGSSDDYSDHLSDYVLIADTVNGRDQGTVVALSVSAALFLLYMLAELILMGMGYYLPRPETDGIDSDDETDGSVDGKPTPAEDAVPDAPSDDDAADAEAPAETDTPESAPESEGGAINEASAEATGEDLADGDAQ